MKNRLLLPLALLFLGIATAKGQDNRILTFEEAKALADEGNAYGEAVVAFHYSVGWQTEKNPELAAKYAIASTQKGHPLGAFRLGSILRSGDGVPKNENQGLELQKRAFQGLNNMSGNPYAITALGVMLFQGKVVPENKKEAARLYKIAADMGFAPAQFNYAMCAESGYGINKNPDIFNDFLDKAANNQYGIYPPAIQWLRDKNVLLFRKLHSSQEDGNIESYPQRLLAYLKAVGNQNKLVDYQLNLRKLHGLPPDRVDTRISKQIIPLDLDQSESGWSNISAIWPKEESELKGDNEILLVPQTPVEGLKIASESIGKRITARSYISNPNLFIYDAMSGVELIRFIPTLLRPGHRDDLMTPIHVCLSKDEKLVSCSTGLFELNGSVGGNDPAYIVNLETMKITSCAYSLSLFLDRGDGSLILGKLARFSADGAVIRPWEGLPTEGLPTMWRNMIESLCRAEGANLFTKESKEELAKRYSREDLLNKDGDGQFFSDPGDAWISPRMVENHAIFDIKWPEVFGQNQSGRLSLAPPLLLISNRQPYTSTTISKDAEEKGHVFDGDNDFWAHVLGYDSPPEGLFANKIGFGPIYISENGELQLNSIDMQGWRPGRTFVVSQRAGGKFVAMPEISGPASNFSKYTLSKGIPSLPFLLPFPIKEGSANRHHFYDTKSGICWLSTSDLGLVSLGLKSFEKYKIYDGIPSFDFFAVNGDLVLGVPNRAEPKLQLWRLNGNLLVDIFPSAAGSLLVAVQEGFYFNIGRPSVAFKVGMRGYPFEQFDLRLNRPDIVLERLGAPDEAIAIAKQLREKRLKRMGVTEEMLQPDFHLPEIEILGDLPSSTAENELTLTIKASDSKYPLDRLRLYVNNVPVNGKEGELLRDDKSQTLERTIPIKLAAGRNKIQVSVLNSAGAESLYANAEVQCTAPRPKPTLYAVAMGVSEYANPEWNLKYAAKDATDILARIHSQSSSSYGEVKELLLTDRDVTKENLTKIREFLSKATVDDTVMMFVAGHGLLDSKYDYYFGTSDIDFENPSEKGIAFEEFDDLLAELPCLKKSLLIDTCHAGELDEDEKKALAAAQSAPTGQQVAMHPVGARGMSVKPIEGARGKSEWYDRLQGLFVDLRRGSGSTILSSSAGAEYALESSEQKNGLFTYAVLEALDGKEGADANKDGSVSISELAEYVKSRVATLTNNKQSPNVRRVNLEADFALTKK